MSDTRVVILGGGLVGTAMALDLARTPGFRVTVADAKPEALSRLAARTGAATLEVDLSSSDAVERTVAGFDLVLGALSSRLGLQTLHAVLEARRPYVDIAFMAEDAWKLDALAKQRGTVAVIDCGVAPGSSNVAIGWAASRMDPCERVEIYVGGLPVVRSWPFEYKAGFAPSDVIEEYVRPARLVEHGQLVVREALSEPELMELPGVGTLEAFNTDGLRSLAYTLDAPFMKEKTLRYPGHIALMRAFRETGLFSEEPIEVAGAKVRPRDLTAALVFPKWAYAEGEADLTVLRVLVEGREAGRRVRHTWDLLDHHDPKTGLSSMSRTTGFSATSMAVLLASGRFSRPGVHPPELVGREPGLYEAFLAELASRGVHLSHRVQQV